MSRSSLQPRVSVNEYPEHLNPFFEDDNHNRIRFWTKTKKLVRSNSFSFSGFNEGFKELRNSIRRSTSKSRRGSTVTSEESSPVILRRNIQETETTLTPPQSERLVNEYGFVIPNHERHSYRYKNSLTPTPRTKYNTGSDDYFTLPTKTHRFRPEATSTPRKTTSVCDHRSNQQLYALPGLARVRKTSTCSLNPFDNDCSELPQKTRVSTISLYGGETSLTRKKRKAPLPPTVKVTENSSNIDDSGFQSLNSTNDAVLLTTALLITEDDIRKPTDDDAQSISAINTSVEIIEESRKLSKSSLEENKFEKENDSKNENITEFSNVAVGADKEDINEVCTNQNEIKKISEEANTVREINDNFGSIIQNENEKVQNTINSRDVYEVIDLQNPDHKIVCSSNDLENEENIPPENQVEVIENLDVEVNNNEINNNIEIDDHRLDEPQVSELLINSDQLVQENKNETANLPSNPVELPTQIAETDESKPKPVEEVVTKYIDENNDEYSIERLREEVNNLCADIEIRTNEARSVKEIVRDINRRTAEESNFQSMAVGQVTPRQILEQNGHLAKEEEYNDDDLKVIPEPKPVPRVKKEIVKKVELTINDSTDLSKPNPIPKPKRSKLFTKIAKWAHK